MNKTELVEAVKNLLGADATKESAGKAVDAVIGGIKAGLKESGSVQLIGFGTFSVTDRPERSGINPRTKEPITIAASKVVKFKPGSGLKEIL
jgi:DNA-binding protein HU-beta